MIDYNVKSDVELHQYIQWFQEVRTTRDKLASIDLESKEGYVGQRDVLTHLNEHLVRIAGAIDVYLGSRTNRKQVAEEMVTKLFAELCSL